MCGSFLGFSPFLSGCCVHCRYSTHICIHAIDVHSDKSEIRAGLLTAKVVMAQKEKDNGLCNIILGGEKRPQRHKKARLNIIKNVYDDHWRRKNTKDYLEVEP